MDALGRQGPGLLMRPARTVLVLGGGVGGATAARHLRRRLPKGDRVILVDRENHHLFQPSLLWQMTGARRREQFQRSLGRLDRRGIEILRGEVTAIDPATRRVRVGDRDLAADAIIVALGAEYDEAKIPGLAQSGHNAYSPQGAQEAHAALSTFAGGRVVILTAAPAYKCPAAPYEAAMLVRDYLERRGVDAEVHLVAAEPGPMGTAGPVVSAAVRTMVESTGIRYAPQHQVVAVDSGTRRIRFADETEIAYDLLIYVPPHRAPSAVRNSGLVDASGWIPVDPHTLATSYGSVYAIGDVTNIPLQSGKSLPKAGVFAHAQADVVAENLVAAWSGQEPTRRFDGVGACFIETGDGRAGYGAGDFYASPLPTMRLRAPSRLWHWGKVLFEKWWLRPSAW